MSEPFTNEPAPICKKIEPRLAEYAAGILQNSARVRVRRHLDNCAACAAQAASLAQITDQLRSMAAAERSVTFRATSVDSIITNTDSAKTVNTTAQVSGFVASMRPWLTRVAPLAAAVFLAGVGVGALWKSEQIDKNNNTDLQRLNDRIVRMEGAQPEVVEAARRSMLPTIREIATSVNSNEQRYAEALLKLAELIESRRRADVDLLTGALADTRENLQRTQSAVLRVAEAVR